MKFNKMNKCLPDWEDWDRFDLRYFRGNLIESEKTKWINIVEIFQVELGQNEWSPNNVGYDRQLLQPWKFMQ